MDSRVSVSEDIKSMDVGDLRVYKERLKKQIKDDLVRKERDEELLALRSRRKCSSDALIVLTREADEIAADVNLKATRLKQLQRQIRDHNETLVQISNRMKILKSNPGRGIQSFYEYLRRNNPVVDHFFTEVESIIAGVARSAYGTIQSIPVEYRLMARNSASALLSMVRDSLSVTLSALRNISSVAYDIIKRHCRS